MKKHILASLLVMLVFCGTSSAQNHHIGATVSYIAPLSPFSKAYGSGYGGGIMYRRFQMTRSLILDANFGYYLTNAKDSLFDTQDIFGNPETVETGNIHTLSFSAGCAWAFIPNGSPYTQPYAGVEFGLNMNHTKDFPVDRYNSTPLSLRVGFMSYIAEKLLLGIETKYTTAVTLGARDDSETTAIGGMLDHYLSVQLSASFSFGK